ncbi:MAG: hypothetical protein IJ262_09295 [Clostridia bacterium]|nr:hypothetical protein [Clostridia bacterium]
MKKKLLKFPFPLIVAVAYVFIGVLGHIWHPTWLIFLLIPAYYEFVAKLDMDRTEMSTVQVLKSIPFASITILAYLILGFFFHLWHPGWLIILLIPVYYSVIPLFKKD